MHASDLSDASMQSSILGGLTVRQRQRLTEILDEYLSALESGIPASRDDLLSQNPDLAEPLCAYLDSLDELHNAAAGFAGGEERAARESRPHGSDEKRLGDYRLLREIGRGGMGVVYEAEQISLGRRVALKVLPFAAVLDSKQIARFKNEAQAAAQLDHPNIVSVYAVGSDRGVHYYAMQLIDGQPLDRAIEELRRLSSPRDGAAEGGTDAGSADTVAEGEDAAGALSPARPSFLTQVSTDKPRYFRTIMRLGIQAAEALQAAHEFGVIHRDIKPSNLLLDGEGKLWVTDFGLARCQTDKTLTRTGDLVGTMRYMSPEQTQGQSALVDQRTDIYSLGATLYELLALEPAFPGDDGPDLLRRLAEQDPRPLKQLQPRIPADLQTVIHKAMARRREDRYTTARDFADDLRRVLESKPTIAKPPTLADRLGKWTRRHHRLVITAACVCLFAAVGLATSTLLIARQKVLAEDYARSAQKRLHFAQDMLCDLGLDINEELAEVAGAGPVRKRLLETALSYYREFVEDAKDDPSFQEELALTYDKIGMLNEKIGSTKEAIAAHENALRLLTHLVAEKPNNLSYRSTLAVCHNNRALVLAATGQTDEARKAYEEAIRLQAEVVGKSGGDEAFIGDLAAFHMNMGRFLNETGDAAQAEASLLEAIRLQQRLLDSQPANTEYLTALAASCNNLAAVCEASQPARAAELYEKALLIQRKVVNVQPKNPKFQRELALTYNNLGAQESRADRVTEAAESYRQAIEIQSVLVRQSPEQNSYRRDLAVSCNNLGLAESKLGQLAGAERSFAQALEIQEKLVSDDPGNIELCSSLGGIYNNRGIVLENLDRFGESAECYRKAVACQQIAYSHAQQVTRYRDFLSKTYFNYGRVLRELGRADEAVRVALARKELWPDQPDRLFSVAEELARAGALLAGGKQSDLSLESCQTLALETLEEAVKAGFQLPADLGTRESFAVLRERREFTNLTKETRTQ